MGLYVRGKQYWITFTNAQGERQWEPTGYGLTERAKAKKRLDTVKAQVEAETRHGGRELGPMTVGRYADLWIQRRRREGIGAARTEAGFVEHHIKPGLGDVLLTELRPRHVREFALSLRSKPKRRSKDGALLGSKTIRDIAGALRCLLADAIADELLEVSPYQLRRKDLPTKRDKDPLWRAGAVFTRDEVEQLVSDPRIPEDRRVLYGLAFLTGMRPGEIAALRFNAYDQVVEPLGRLQVAYAWDTGGHRLKDTKTERTRDVPVHPTLARILAAWKLGGWQKRFGRAPAADDLVLPRRGVAPDKLRDAYRNENRMRLRLHDDLETLGLRKRRLYDARRTLISLSIADGARKDVLRWITHGPSGDIVDVYTTLPWATLCEEMGKLTVSLREGKVLELRAVASAPVTPDRDSDRDSPEPATKNPRNRAGFLGSVMMGDAGLERVESIGSAAAPPDSSPLFRGETAPASDPSRPVSGSPVTLSRSDAQPPGETMKEDCVLIYLKHDLPGGAAGVQIKVPLDPALLPKLRTLTHEQATDLMPELAVAVEKVLLERLSAFGSLRDPSTKEET